MLSLGAQRVFFLAGLISTTSRQLDREYKAEHILEVGNDDCN